MASSKSDADIRLKATLDTAEVQRELQDVGRDAGRSLDAASLSGDKLARSLDKVGDAAKMSAQQITRIAVGLSGMAMQLGASVLESRGMSTEARYLQGAGQMAMQGAQLGAYAMGPKGMVIGAAAGAGVGAGKTFFDIQSDEKKHEQALTDLAAGNREALTKFEDLRAAQNESAEFYARVASDALSASEKTEALTRRMEEFADEAETLRQALDSDELQRDGKGFAETMQAYAAALREVDKARGAARAIDDTGDKAGAMIGGRDVRDYADALTRIGGSIGGGDVGGVAGIQREGVDIAKQQLRVLESINNTGVGTWA